MKGNFVLHATEDQDDDDDIDTALLYADFDTGYVRTNCGDFYYDYDISFDDFLKFAEFIKMNRDVLKGGNYGKK